MMVRITFIITGAPPRMPLQESTETPAEEGAYTDQRCVRVDAVDTPLSTIPRATV